ncbi:Hypothetical protein ORPV_878 [Orpheovirus IHUMI-LCC2]|uniref:Uncharacterized protein n=1 Tax=Orpheovirus IHUMI-LCC2 TaxID=2023057 RepID=A0A2I2L5F8_9VIRU|nr:Hypothetical protein ORPV_878 [Orpheovirus IHUMI-LCC2]SNW62782.1 Hypothetical protein ORPV_878 [Orpheovirus IHUMI-LCC2]
MIYQFLQTYVEGHNIYGYINKKLEDVSYMFHFGYRDNDETGNEINYLYVSGDNLFLQYYSEEVDYIIDLLNYVMTKGQYKNVYLWFPFDMMSGGDLISLAENLNKIENPINILVNGEADTDDELFRYYDLSKLINELHRVRIITDTPRHILLEEIIPDSVPNVLQQFIAAFHPIIKGQLGDDNTLRNITVTGIAILDNEEVVDAKLNDKWIAYVRSEINRFPKFVTTVYVYTQNKKLLNDIVSGFDREVIFIEHVPFPMDASYIYYNF